MEALHWTPRQVAELTLPQWLALSRGKAGKKIELRGNVTPEAMEQINEWHRRRNSPEAKLRRAERMLARYEGRVVDGTDETNRVAGG
jgi:hypothetical protein